MDNEIIKRHNEVVGADDIVVHGGDFTLKKDAEQYIRRLNGQHIFLKGSHDYWMNSKKDIDYLQIWEEKINGIYVVVCHYAMRTWSASHYNSWQLFGHSHGKLCGVGKQMDIGVDTHNFFPYSFEEIKKIMDKKEDNPNFINIKK
jgi:calcineurin-like phosphoesterase family protein